MSARAEPTLPHGTLVVMKVSDGSLPAAAIPWATWRWLPYTKAVSMPTPLTPSHKRTAWSEESEGRE